MPQISIKHHCLQTNVSTFGVQHWIYTCKFLCHSFHIIHRRESTAAAAAVNRNRDKKRQNILSEPLGEKDEAVAEARWTDLGQKNRLSECVCVCFFLFQLVLKRKTLAIFPPFLILHLVLLCTRYICMAWWIEMPTEGYICMSHVNTQKIFCILQKKSCGTKSSWKSI